MKKLITTAAAIAVLLTAQTAPLADSFIADTQTVITASAADSTPAKVTGVKVKAASPVAGTLSWKKVSKAKGYRIYVYNTKTKKYTKLATVSKNSTVSYKLKGLKGGSTYKYKVRAYNKVNGKLIWGKTSAAVTLKTPAYEPGKVKNLKVLSSAENSITLSWDSVKNAGGYRVYKYNSLAESYDIIATVPGATKYTVKGLKAGVTYKFRVRPYSKYYNKTYWGGHSDPLSVKIAAPVKPAYDSETEKALRNAGQSMFDENIEYYISTSQWYMNKSSHAIAEPYKLTQTKVLAQTDKEYFVCGVLTAMYNDTGIEFIYDYDASKNRPIYLPVACKAYVSGGKIKVESYAALDPNDPMAHRYTPYSDSELKESIFNLLLDADTMLEIGKLTIYKTS